MAWASPMNATSLFVFSTLVLIATGFVTWRFRRGASARAPKSARRPASAAPRRSANVSSATAQRTPFMAAPSDPDGERTDRMPLQFMPPRPTSQRPRFAATTVEPFAESTIDTPPRGAGGALYIGSVNLNPEPPPVAVPPAARRAPPTTARRPAIESRTSQALAEDFMQWVSESLASRSLQVNTLQSALHFTDAGMVLVYPALFQAYSGACAPPALKGAAANTQRTQAVLNAVCELGWHQPGPFESRLLHFELLQQRAEPAIIKGVLIQSPQRFVTPLPSPNPALSRLI